jgi:hypothetical protein
MVRQEAKVAIDNQIFNVAEQILLKELNQMLFEVNEENDDEIPEVKQVNMGMEIITH